VVVVVVVVGEEGFFHDFFLLQHLRIIIIYLFACVSVSVSLKAVCT